MRSRGSPRFGASGKIVGVYGVVEEVVSHPGDPGEWAADGPEASAPHAGIR